MGLRKSFPCIYFLIFIFLFLFLFLFSTGSFANPMISDYTATYSIQAYGINLGESVQSFKMFEILENNINKNNYIFSIETNASALFYSDYMIQTSAGFIDKNNALIPEKFNSHRDRKNQNESINFDWENNLAHSEKSAVNNKKFNQEDQDIALKPGVGDVLSIQIGLRQAILENSEDLKNLKNKSFNFTLIKSNKIQNYDFKMTQHEKLKTILGDLDTLKIERVSSSDGRKLDIYWLAEKYQYVLVQSEQVEINPDQPKEAPKVLVILSLKSLSMSRVVSSVGSVGGHI